MSPYTAEYRGKYHYDDPVLSTRRSSWVASKEELKGSTPPLTQRKTEETEDMEQDKKPESSQANQEDANDNASTSDLKLEAAENGENMPEQGSLATRDMSADSTIPKEDKLPEVQKMASDPILAPLTTSPAAITSINRVMAKACKFPLVEWKRLQFPNTKLEPFPYCSPQAMLRSAPTHVNPLQKRLQFTTTVAPISPHGDIPSISAVPNTKLEPFPYCSPQAMLRFATRVKKTLIHTQNRVLPTPVLHEKFNHAELVRDFTYNFQKPFSSPDMRKVMMKKGKRHEFFGHHAYDYH